MRRRRASTSGCLQGGQRGIELLEASLDVLEMTEAVLERARTLVELGAALRRSNQRVAAREHLYAGLHLADGRGAERLAGGQKTSPGSGARPRRRAVTGPGALTAKRRACGPHGRPRDDQPRDRPVPVRDGQDGGEPARFGIPEAGRPVAGRARQGARLDAAHLRRPENLGRSPMMNRSRRQTPRRDRRSG